MSVITSGGRLPVAIIAAVDRRLAIGRENQLPWRLPDDLKRFKSLTLGQPLLMGRKTAQSLGRALPGRQNIVLSRAEAPPYPDMQLAASLHDALALIAPPTDSSTANRLCVIGGGEIYALLLPLADTLHLTHVDTEVDAADAHFPQFVHAHWKEQARQHHPADDRHPFNFDFVDYVRHAEGQD